MGEDIALRLLPPRRAQGHAGRSAGAAGRPVDDGGRGNHHGAGIAPGFRLTAPHDVMRALDCRIIGVNHVDHLRQLGDELQGHAAQVIGRVIIAIAEIRLAFHDGIEIAAIGDVKDQLPQFRVIKLHIAGQHERRHIDETHRGDLGALLYIMRLNHARRRVQPQDARRFRRDQPFLYHKGGQPDRRVATHRNAARCFQIQNPGIAIVTGRWHQHRPRHHAMAARFAHDAAADRVKSGDEILPPFALRGPLQFGLARDHQTHGHARRMAFDAFVFGT